MCQVLKSEETEAQCEAKRSSAKCFKQKSFNPSTRSCCCCFFFIFGYQPKRTGELLHRQAAVQANYIPKLQMFPFKK